MLVRTTCNAIIYNRKLTYTLAHSVVYPSRAYFMFSPFDPLHILTLSVIYARRVAHTSRVANLSVEIMDTCTVMVKLCRQDCRALRAAPMAILMSPKGTRPEAPQRDATRVARTLRTEYRVYENIVETLKRC